MENKELKHTEIHSTEEQIKALALKMYNSWSMFRKISENCYHLAKMSVEYTSLKNKALQEENEKMKHEVDKYKAAAEQYKENWNNAVNKIQSLIQKQENAK